MPQAEIVQPLSPYQVMEYAVAAVRARWLATLVTMVNDSLCAQAENLDETGAAIIKPALADPLDPQGWHYWQTMSYDIIHWFQEKGWIVEPGGTKYSFVFRLPGTLINPVTNGDISNNKE